LCWLYVELLPCACTGLLAVVPVIVPRELDFEHIININAREDVRKLTFTACVVILTIQQVTLQVCQYLIASLKENDICVHDGNTQSLDGISTGMW
jgi:hypothetical protein